MGLLFSTDCKLDLVKNGQYETYRVLKKVMIGEWDSAATKRWQRMNIRDRKNQTCHAKIL